MGAIGAAALVWVTMAPAAASPDRDGFLEMWARSYFPGRSGDIMLVPGDGVILTVSGTPFMHGSPWEYDTRIPLIFFGPGQVRPGRYPEAASHEDVAATLATVLGLPRRPAATGRVLREILPVRGADGAGGGAPGAGGPPRVIALLVLDAFRADYVERYPKETATLRRLAERGALFPQAGVDYLPTVTAVAHTTLATGTWPSVHGIVGNVLFDRSAGKSKSAYRGMSAEDVRALSLADRWEAWTEGRAVIAVQAGTFYPAAALAGHGGCLLGGHPFLATYFDSRSGGWTTNSECYVLPEYLTDQRIQELAGGSGVGEAPRPSALRRDPTVFPRFEAAATLEMVEREPFGTDEVADLLLVNLKATDYVAHRYGPESPESRRAVAEVDRQVALIVEALEAKAGPGGLLLVVTADHGMPPEPEPGGRHLVGELVSSLDRHFDPGGEGIVDHFSAADNQVYLDHERLAALGRSVEEVARYAEGLPYVFAAYPEGEVRKAAARLP